MCLTIPWPGPVTSWSLAVIPRLRGNLVILIFSYNSRQESEHTYFLQNVETYTEVHQPLRTTTHRQHHVPLSNVLVGDRQWGHCRDSLSFLCVTPKGFAQRATERGGGALQWAPVFTCKRPGQGKSLIRTAAMHTGSLAIHCWEIWGLGTY